MTKFITLIICIIILILVLWRNTLFNIDTHLINWRDELFVMWIFKNNILHFSSLDFNNIFETNSLYSFKYSLSFAEQLFFPSFLAFLINIFSKNPLIQHNLLIISNSLLIFLSSLLFFNNILKHRSSALLSSFYVTFAPYFFTEVSHFQMIFYWPQFVSLYFISKYLQLQKKSSILWAGLFMGLQFLSSVYLGIMSLVVATLYLFTQAIFNNYQILITIKRYILFLLIFFLVSGVSFYGYYLMNTEYGVKRDYGEFVTYSAHLTDYLFPNTNQNSLLYNTPLFQKIKSYNHHPGGAAFLGLIPLLMALFYLYPQIKKDRQSLSLKWSFNSLSIFALGLIILGILFSLGPRLSVNGKYTEIPLFPYAVLLKIFHPLEIIRCVVRWQIVAMLGTAILIGLSYQKIEAVFLKRKTWFNFFLIDIFIVLFMFEFYPLTPLHSSKENLQNPAYEFLSANVCREPGKAILEYPFMYRNLDGDIVKNVHYMALILFQSTKHQCRTLSGYYGFEPDRYFRLKEEFENGFSDKDIKIIRDLNFDFIKFNKYAVSQEELQKIISQEYFDHFDNIYEDKETIILKLKPIRE